MKRSQTKNPLPEGTFIVGNKLMARCYGCGKIIRIDKPVLGSLHVCAPDKRKWHFERHGDIEVGWVDGPLWDEEDKEQK